MFPGQKGWVVVAGRGLDALILGRSPGALGSVLNFDKPQFSGRAVRAPPVKEVISVTQDVQASDTRDRQVSEGSGVGLCETTLRFIIAAPVYDRGTLYRRI